MAGSEEKGLSYFIFKKKYPNWVYAILAVLYIIANAVWIISNR